MEKFNSSYTGVRMDLLRYVEGRNLSILDIGCANGANAAFLRDRELATYIEGVEFDPKMAEEAARSLDKVVVGDIEDRFVYEQLTDRKYDFILLGDVLEHLRDPWRILHDLSLKLEERGKIIISVPNIGHIDVFIHIFIKGYWPYNERGIFDKTHIRMFTKKNVEELVKSAKLSIVEMNRKYRYRDRIDSVFPFYGRLLKRFLRDLYTFQFIVVCEKPPVG